MPLVTDKDTGQPFRLDTTTAEYLADYREWSEQINSCDHPNSVVRRFRRGTGITQFGPQCQRCGHVTGKWLKKTEVAADVSDADMSLKERYGAMCHQKYSEMQQKHVRLQKGQDDQFNERYQQYLASPEWARRRAKVLRRANGICEGCLENKATEVHHTTYQHVFDELLFELVAVCANCHEKCHGKKAIELIDDELPCYGCRWQEGDIGGALRCGKFSISAASALAADGPCGTDARELEPLK